MNRAGDWMPGFRMLLIVSVLVLPCASRVVACPFCSAVSQTLSQEIEAADVAVLTRLVKLPPEVGLDDEVELDLDDPDSGAAEFEVVEVLRGENAPAVGSIIKVVYFGSDSQKKSFLISGLQGAKIDWSTPLPLTERAIDYIKSFGTLPEKGADRLAFFLNHLEDEDPLLAQDAYDEFGRAPYEDVIAVGDRMNRMQLIEWIEDSAVGPTRRRLYLTMLGICGQPEDIAILESLLLYDYQQMKPGIVAGFAAMAAAGPGPFTGATVLNDMVKADVRRKQQCLDALIAAYLKLEGPSGLPLIEDRFLTNPAAEYTHVYAAVMALRFHGEETDVIPKPRLLETVRLVLDNSEIADQVIPDLARWEDWSVMDQLVNKFKESDKNAWIRQPVISYLLAASDQTGEVSERANAALSELEELDPKAVKQARSYMAFGLLARAKPKKSTTEASGDSKVAASTDGAKSKSNKSTQNAATEALAATESEPASTTVAKANPEKAETAAPIASSIQQGPNRMILVGGPLIAGVLLFGVFAVLLRGAEVRSTSGD